MSAIHQFLSWWLFSASSNSGEVNEIYRRRVARGIEVFLPFSGLVVRMQLRNSGEVGIYAKLNIDPTSSRKIP